MANKDTNSGIRKKSQEADALLEKIRRTNEEVQSLSIQIKNYGNEISELAASIVDRDSTAKEQLEIIKDEIKVMQSSYEELEEKKKNIDDALSEYINPLVSIFGDEDNPTIKAEKISNLLTTSVKKVEEINSLITKLTTVEASYKKILVEYQSYSTNLDELKIKIEDEDTGIEALLESVENTNTTCRKLYDQISDYEIKAKELLEKTKSIRDESIEIKNSIKEDETDIKKIHNELNEMYSIAANTAKGGIFHKHRNFNEIQKWVWIFLAIAVYAGWGILLVQYVFRNEANSPLLNIILKAIITSVPFVFALLLLTKNAQISQRSAEKYAFKSVLAFSLRQEVHELAIKFPDKKEEILNFFLSQLNRLYKEPYDIKGKDNSDLLYEIKQQLEEDIEAEIEQEEKN